MPGKSFKVSTIFKAVDQITRPIARMQSRVRRMTRSVDRNLRSMNRTADATIGGMRRLATIGAAGLLTIGLGMADVVRTGADFEQTLVDAGTKFKNMATIGTESFGAIEHAAMDTGATTEFTASQAARAIRNMALAGFDAEQSIAGLRKVVDFATAANLELDRATTIATKTMGAFNLRSKDAIQNADNLQRVTDVLTVATSRGAVEMEDLFLAISRGGKTFELIGQDVETTAALLSKLGDAGVDASIAGTGLKRIGLAVAGVDKKSLAVIERVLGVKVRDQNGFRNTADIFVDLSAAIKKLPGQHQLRAIEAIFGKIGMTSAATFLDSAEGVRELRDELRGLNGQTKMMANLQRDTVSGSLKSLWSSIEAVKLSLFNANKGPLKDVIDQTTDWIRANRELITIKVGEWIGWIVKNWRTLITWGKRLAIVTGAVFGLILAVKALNAVMAVLNILMSMNPVGLIILAIAAATAAVVAFAYDLGGVRTMFEEMPTWAKWALRLAAPLILVGEAAGWVVDNWDVVSEFFDTLFNKTIPHYVNLAEKAFKALARFAQPILDALKPAWDAFTQAVEPAVKVMEKRFEKLMTIIQPVVDAISKATDLLAKDVWQSLSLNTIGDLQEAGASAPSEFIMQERARQAAAGVVSPQERISRSINENNSTGRVIVGAEQGATVRADGKLPDSVQIERSGVD